MIAPLALLVACAGAGADELEAYLQKQGLTQLLAAHLETKLDEVQGDERNELILRLADLYARLLENATGDEREFLEKQSRQLLTEAPPAGANELRLALLRGTYRTAERIAERWRMRDVDEDALERARAALDELLPDLRQLSSRIEADTVALKTRLRRSSGRAAATLASRVEASERLEKQAAFMMAWALYYDAWLNNEVEQARQAQRIFGELIDPSNPALQASDVSVDIREHEAMARSILGMALCKSLTAQLGTSMAWLALLEHPETFKPIKESVDLWRDAVYLDRGEYAPIVRQLDAWDADEFDEPAVTWLRLVAVYALEDERQSRVALNLVQRVVTALAARGELQQVLDLAKRYGTDRLGDSGFAVGYVRGILTYQETRGLHGGDEPTMAPVLQASYREAAALLAEALRAQDADQFAVAVAACARLIGWSYYFAGDFIDAKGAFVVAADLPAATDPADALWMAIVCLDKVIQQGRSEFGSEMTQLVGRFLAEYPASEHAPRLVLKQAVASDQVTPDMIHELLSIPPSSDVYDSARSKAAQGLYRLFRDSQKELRVQYGSEYLSVALPMLAAGAAGDSLDVQRHLVRIRRILEVSLADGIDRLVAARTALDAFEGLSEDTPGLVEDVVAEVDYRRLQYLLKSDDFHGAAAIADRLWLDDDTSLWSRLSSRAIFKIAHKRWKLDPGGSLDDRAPISFVVKFGRRVLEEYDDQPFALEQTNVIGWYVAVGEAAMIVWERSHDRDIGEYAFGVYRDYLLQTRPNNAGFLRATGILAEAYGDEALALTCWRKLVSGSDAGTDGWYEARFHVVDLLKESDRERAQSIMTQHMQLYPDFGPPPWGDKLRAVAEDLGLLERSAGG